MTPGSRVIVADVVLLIAVLLIAGTSFVIQSCDKDAGVPAVKAW